MKSLETIIATICVVLILFIVPLVIVTVQAGDSLEVCAKNSAEQLTADIAAEGVLDVLKVQDFTQSLMNCGYTGEFAVTVYTYEDAADGSEHRYVTTWEEILMVLESGESFEFPENCYVNISVPSYKPENAILGFMFARKGFENPVVLGRGI